MNKNFRRIQLAALFATLPVSMAFAQNTNQAEQPSAVQELRADIKEGAANAGNYADDAMVTAKVKTAFAKDDRVSTLDISVTTERGVVTLTGTVDNDAQRKAAEEIAEHVEGVNTVANRLAVAN